MPASNLILFAEVAPWIQPLWMICLGFLLAMLIALAVYGVARLISRPFAATLEELALDGLLQPLVYVAAVPAAIGLLSLPFVSYGDVFSQVYPSAATYQYNEVEVAAQITTEPNGNIRMELTPVEGGETKVITARSFRELPAIDFAAFEIYRNSQRPFFGPDLLLVLGTASFLLVLMLLTLGLRLVFPKVAAIALAAMREGIAQPLFWVCVTVGSFLLLLFIWIPYHTFGEDIKMLKDTGLMLIMLTSIVLAVWNASVSIASEIEGRTALTLLSNSVGRREFVFGKFFGVLGPVVVLFFVLGLVFLVTVSYKVVYEGQEYGKPDVSYEQCTAELVQILPGLALAFMETVVLAAISVAISTRLPMAANMLICASIYGLGHIVPLLVQSSVGMLEPVQFVGQLIATVLPVFEHFNMYPAIAGGREVPLDYLLTAGVYCLTYTGFALLGALLLFEDRDLA